MRATLHYIRLAAVNDVDLWERNELIARWHDAQDALGWNDETKFFPWYGVGRGQSHIAGFGPDCRVRLRQFGAPDAGCAQ